MSLFLISYSFFLIVGGIMGCLKGSLISLIAGGLSGLLILWLACKKTIGAKTVVCLVIFALDAFFSYRYFSSMKFFPAGMMTFVSTPIFFIAYLRLKKASDKPLYGESQYPN